MRKYCSSPSVALLGMLLTFQEIILYLKTEIVFNKHQDVEDVCKYCEEKYCEEMRGLRQIVKSLSDSVQDILPLWEGASKRYIFPISIRFIER